VVFSGATNGGTASVTASYGGDASHNASPTSIPSTIFVKNH
jgi:hypothetical protein